jgi:hypothetical protein
MQSKVQIVLGVLIAIELAVRLILKVALNIKFTPNVVDRSEVSIRTILAAAKSMGFW